MKTNTPISSKYKKINRTQEVFHRLSKNKGAMVGFVIVIVCILCAVLCPVFIDFDTQIAAIDATQMLQHPSAEHIMGTDQFGRDVFLRLIYGARYSLSVGFVSVLISLVIGASLGAIAGYYGGIVDDIIMRLNDMLNAIPGILLGIIIVAALGANTVNLMLAIGISTVPSFARVARASVMTTRNQEYVQAARAIGLPEWRIIFLHVLPNCLSQLIVQVTLKIGQSIVNVSSLSFLGLGVPAPAPEWGNMLSDGRAFIRGYSYMTLYPGLAIMIVVLAFNLLGDGLRDALDPKLKR